MWRVRRLHVQFYLAILATFLMLMITGSLLWNFVGTSRNDIWSVDTGAQLAAALLPPATASAAEQDRAIDELSAKLHVDLSLYDSRDQLIGDAGGIPHLDARQLRHEGRFLGRGRYLWILTLPDGRRLVVQPGAQRQPHGVHIAVILASIILAFALGAYPIARRLTRRLARLQAGVEQFGAGNLATRVKVEGHDEVAALARSFNASAERIEELIRSHKLLLANCSHELRTPLARIRLALEKLSRDSGAELHDEVARSIAELDALIGEMLLASRLDAVRGIEHAEDVDLLALAAEEAAHFDRSAEGQPVIVRGDPNLLRRMIRNLLDNAQRHAGGATRIHVGSSAAGQAELHVEDQGGGVSPDERQKIFEPFFRSAQASAAVKGFGLGLALVRQIARAHGGEVRYDALPEKGSRFTVRLPQVDPVH